MSDKATGLARLREPFEPNQINLLPRNVRKNDQDRFKCESSNGRKVSMDGKYCGGYHALSIHLDYVGHAALTHRLLEVDPEWSWEPLAIGQDGLPVFDRNGGLWIRLSICGVTRLGYGDAQGKDGSNAVKEAIGDALRNAGMRFGAALDLWHKGDLSDAKEEQGEESAHAPEPQQSGVNWQQSLIDAKGNPERLAALRSMAKQAGAPEHYMKAVDAALHESTPIEGTVTHV